MNKIFFISTLICFSTMGVVQAFSKANQPSSVDRQALLEESILQVIDAVSIWKEEVKTDSEFVQLLNAINAKLQDPNVTVTIKVFYAILLSKVHATDDSNKQKEMLRHILSQSAHELMQEAAVMIQLLKEEQA